MTNSLTGNFWLSSSRMKATASSIEIPVGKLDEGGVPAINVTNGMLKAVEKLFRDIITNGWTTGLGVDPNGFIWSRSVNHDPSHNEDIVVCLEPKTKKLALAKVDSTGAMKAYDEPQRCPYEVLLTVIGYLWNEKSVDFSKYSKESFVWDSQKDLKTLIAEYESTGKLTKTTEVAGLLSAIYNVGSKIMPTAMEDFEELRAITKQGTDLTKEMFPKNSAAEFFEASAALPTVEADLKNGTTSLQIMKGLRKMFADLVKDYVSGLSEAAKSSIPTEAEIMSYIPTDEFTDICLLLADNLKRKKRNNNILFWGPPGNGKSAFARAVAYVFQLPYYFEQGFDSKDAGDYAGTTIATNGTLHTSCETAFVKAVREGGVFADDDFNYGKAGEQVFKNSVLEEPFRAKLANQTEVVRHNFCIYIATANPNCSGSREIPSAFKNRAYIDMYWKPLSDELLKQHVMNESELEDEKIVDKMIEVYHVINTSIGSGLNKVEEAEYLTPRNLVAWATQTRVLGGAAKRAAEYNIIGAIGENASEEFIKKVRETIIAPRFKK